VFLFFSRVIFALAASGVCSARGGF